VTSTVTQHPLIVSPPIRLSHNECVRLLGTPERGRRALVSINGDPPVPLGCLVLDQGRLLIPTGTDRTLVRASAGRPVTVEFAHDDDGESWTVTGTGLARPMGWADRPSPLPRTTFASDMKSPFDNGIVVVLARLTGHRRCPAPRG